MKHLRIDNIYPIQNFREETEARSHRFWQRDALAIHMNKREKFEQKLNYIHNNPLQEHWDLAVSPEQYRWSSAKFYETGYDEFNILTHYREVF